MRQDYALGAATVVATIVVTLLVIQWPGAAGIGAIAVAALAVFVTVKGWWRRALVVTILAMVSGASHIEALAAVGGSAKIIALGLLAVATFAVTQGKDRQYRNGMHKAALRILWLTAWLSIASIIWSELRATTAVQVVTYVAFVFVLSRTSTVRWQDRKTMAGDMGTIYWASTAALTVGAAMAYADIGESVSTFSDRHQGLLNNPNLLGMIAAITLTIGLGLAAHKRSPLIWASLLIPASQVILSESRTAMVAAGAGVIWAVIRGSIARMIAVGCLVGIGLLAARFFEVNLVGDSLDRFTAMEGGSLLNSRTMAWSDVFDYVHQNPLGIGWAATADGLAALNAAGVTSGLSSIHNSYLQLIFELGWIGLVPAVLIVVLFLVVAFKAEASGLGVGMVATVVTGALIHLAESAMFGVGQPYPYLFWLAVMAAIVGTEPKLPKGKEKKPGKFYSLEPTTGKVRAVR